MKFDRSPDKEQTFKKNYTIKHFKEVTEDKANPIETVVLYDSEGREISKIVKVDGKLHESSATTDAQDSGIYADFAKKIGIKEDDLTYTKPSSVTAQMVVEEDKMKKSAPMSKIGRAASAMRKCAGSSLQKSPDKIAQLKEQMKPQDPKSAMANAIEKIKMAHRPKDNSSAALEQKVRTRYGLNKADGDSGVLDYSKINKPKKADPSQERTLDYSTHKTPEKIPAWKKKLEQKQYIKQKEDIASAGGLKDAPRQPSAIEEIQARQKKFGKTMSSLKKAIRGDKLKKDVVDFKTKKKIGESGQDITQQPKLSMDTRSRDQKIKDALARQGEKGSPYANTRNMDMTSAGSAPSQPLGPNSEFRSKIESLVNQRKEGGTAHPRDKSSNKYMKLRSIMSKKDLNKTQGVPKGVDPDKQERCVKEVKKQGKEYNPYAVCNASLQKALSSLRKNKTPILSD